MSAETTDKRKKPVPYMVAILANCRVEWYEFNRNKKQRPPLTHDDLCLNSPTHTPLSN